MEGDDDLCIFCGIVIYLFDLDFTFVIGLDDRIDDIGSGYAEWDLIDNQGVFVELLDLGPNPYPSAAKTSVVCRDICKASGREIRDVLIWLTSLLTLSSLRVSFIFLSVWKISSI